MKFLSEQFSVSKRLPLKSAGILQLILKTLLPHVSLLRITQLNPKGVVCFLTWRV